MAFVPVRTTYKLVFADPEYNGLEVYAKAGSISDYMEISKLASIDLTPPITELNLEPVIELFKTFAGDPRSKRPGVLESWNIEEPAGHPVPVSWQGMRSLELVLALHIINAWMDAVVGAVAPLAIEDDGDLVASIPMDVAS